MDEKVAFAFMRLDATKRDEVLQRSQYRGKGGGAGAFSEGFLGEAPCQVGWALRPLMFILL